MCYKWFGIRRSSRKDKIFKNGDHGKYYGLHHVPSRKDSLLEYISETTSLTKLIVHFQGLLPFLKKCQRPTHVSEFKGSTVGIDVYCWLHKGAFGCAEKLVKGIKTDGYITYVMKYVDLLLFNGIKPVLVFDGRFLPSKAETEKKRRENRTKYRKMAKDHLLAGQYREGWYL